jgi:hypothetical protein
VVERPGEQRVVERPGVARLAAKRTVVEPVLVEEPVEGRVSGSIFERRRCR